jgi:hypothetical protein
MREPKAHGLVAQGKAFGTRLCAPETTETVLASCMILACAAVLFHLDVDSFYLTRLVVTRNGKMPTAANSVVPDACFPSIVIGCFVGLGLFGSQVS